MIVIDLKRYFIDGEQWLVNALKHNKHEVFPVNFKFILIYNYDEFNADGEPGIVLDKTIKYAASFDIPFHFITIRTSYSNTHKDFLKLKKVYAAHESDVGIETSDVEFTRVIKNKDSFCILPWIHYYVNQQGDICACCEGDENFPLGNIKNVDIAEIPNLPEVKKLRVQLLNNQQPKHCNSCWTKEKNNIKSNRLSMNEKFKHHIDFVNLSAFDGTVDNFSLKYVDFRDNNLCNLKCRMCSGKFSSSIAQEEYQIWGTKKYIELSNIKDNKNKILNFLENEIQNVESIYFAGGEPLLIDSHYQILELLLLKNKNCEILYNTNFTNLSYKNINVVDYWKQFSNVTIGASIDLTGVRASYVRHGTDYAQFKKNYLVVKDFVNFKITSVLSLYNIFDLQTLQTDWLELGIPAKNIVFSNLINPECMSVQVLPAAFKEKAAESIFNYIEYLKSVPNSAGLIQQWNKAVQFMLREDRSFLISDFFKINDEKDQHRNESFDETFPEFAGLRKYA